MHFVSVSELMGPDWRFLGDRSADASLTWQCFSGRPKQNAGLVQRRLKLSLRSAVKAAVLAAKEHEAGVLVSHLPGVTLRANLLRNRIASDLPHIAFAFNFTDLPSGWRRRLYRRGLGSVDEFVVFSAFERTLYAREFGLPEERFHFVHWAMDAPEIDVETPVPFSRPYLVALGGEGRDYRTLLQAVSAKPDIRLALIARPASVAGLPIPDNVRLFTNVPSEMAWAIAKRAAGMVLPLKGDRTANGHVTLVGAQLLGLPLAITESVGVTDYLDDESAILFPAGDAAQLGTALQRMVEDREGCARLASVAQQRAMIRSNPSKWVDYFRNWADRARSGTTK